MKKLNHLYEQWRASKSESFCLFSDSLWLQLCKILRDAELSWLNNNLHLFDKIDSSWSFQFKQFEREVVLKKDVSVSDENSSDYICNWSENNLYAIRVLQQKMRRQRSTRKSLLMINLMNFEILKAAAQMFELKIYRIDDDWNDAKKKLKELFEEKRFIIFAAIWANDQEHFDDFCAIKRLSKHLSFVLHVDASRNFDFVMSLSESIRRQLDISRLILLSSCLDESQFTDKKMTICAATIVTAEMNCTYSSSIMTLKSQNLENVSSDEIEYLKSLNNTLCDSRDVIDLLLSYVQKQRFNINRRRNIYSRCLKLQQYLISKLIKRKIFFETFVASLNMLVYSAQTKQDVFLRNLDLLSLENDNYLFIIQSSVIIRHLDVLIESLCDTFLNNERSTLLRSMSSTKYSVSEYLSRYLRSVVNHWHYSTRTSSEYCLNQVTYSALEFIMSRFLSMSISIEWTRIQEKRILDDRKTSFSLSSSERITFTAHFITNSTMSNRIDLYAALSCCLNAFVYFSIVTHYSVRKIVSDNDILTARWFNKQRSRFVEILTDDLNRMISEELVKQIAKDKATCQLNDQAHEIILLVNIDITFTEERNDVLELRQALLCINSKIAYIHADEILNFDFSSHSVCLSKSKEMTKNDLSVVQDITLSHHKTFDIMISDEVIYYSSKGQKLINAVSYIESRVIFKTWVFQKMYSQADLARMIQYCHENAQRLKRDLKAVRVMTRYNADSIITLMKRSSAWITHQFQLALEEGWVHYIIMSHISSSVVDEFIEIMTMFERSFSIALHKIEKSLRVILNEQIKISRFKSTDSLSFFKTVIFCENVYMRTQKNLEEHKIFELEDFKQRFAYDATSFVTLNLSDNSLVAFLSTSSLERFINAWSVMLRSDLQCNVNAVKTLYTECLDLLSKSLEIAVNKFD